MVKSIQCRIQNKTPATGGRLLFNKIKKLKIAHGIIVNKITNGEQMYYWNPQRLKELKDKGLKLKYYNYSPKFKDQTIEELEDQDQQVDIEDNQK